MTFKKVDTTNHQRPEGKACILVSGYNEKELTLILDYTKKVGIENLIEVKNQEMTLKQIIDAVKDDIINEINEKAIVLNAISDKELNAFIHDFKTLGLPRPLFAVVTPTSINWKFKELVMELLEEKKAFQNRNKK